MIKEVRLPEVGENIESGEVVKVLVSVGEEIKLEQPIVEVETDKAIFEVPSTEAGKVVEILVKEGDEIKINGIIIKVETESAGAVSVPEETAETPESPEVKTQKIEIKKENIKDRNYEDLRDLIIKDLSELTNQKTNEKLIKWICKREALYSGPHNHKYPDIVFQLKEGYGCVLEIVLDGATEDVVKKALKIGIEAAVKVPGVNRISAGNYGGKLGKYKIFLRELGG